MNFLLVLAAIMIEFMASSVAALRSPRWSAAWLGWLTRQFSGHARWRGELVVLLALVIPVLATAWLTSALLAWSAVLGHLVTLAILCGMLGPLDLNGEIENYRQALQRTPHGGTEAMPDFTTMAIGVDLGPASGEQEFDDSRAALAALALAAERAWFAPLFWFFVLGPFGAVLYRLCANLVQASAPAVTVSGAIIEVEEALAWLPGRITALALGVAGTLVPVLESMRVAGILRWGGTTAMVARAALAAIDHGRISEVIGGDVGVYRLNQMQALVHRALKVWLVFLAAAAVVI